MSGELPPSSSATRLSDAPALAPTSRPTAVDPVNEIIATFGSAVSAAPGSASPGSTWKTPAGSPARASAAAITNPHGNVVCRSGLRTTGFPRQEPDPPDGVARVSG